ncbi:MAG: hypothetical protein CMH54_10440 [Myxococcales bacterium]|nr:hypothetical protein [Myxococcales bacterium]
MWAWDSNRWRNLARFILVGLVLASAACFEADPAKNEDIVDPVEATGVDVVSTDTVEDIAPDTMEEIADTTPPPAPFCGDGSCNGTEGTTDCPDDCGTNCGDGACNGNEDSTNCPEDCGTNCGDGVCNPPESSILCPADCGSDCGDSACNGNESSVSCPEDCGSSCGDGTCNGNEESTSCPDDCGVICGDGTCNGGEESTTCPGDCGDNCGDGVCNGGEGTTTCPGDCGTNCGDGTCNGDEGTTTCPGDCGTNCGDGTCNGGEGTTTCPGDCGTNCGDGTCNGGEGTTTCPADCGSDFSCGNGGWNCSNCAAGESCVFGTCAPTSMILSTPLSAPNFVCPEGYSVAGRWQGANGSLDGNPDGYDYQGFMVDDGWLYLCSAEPDKVFMAITLNDCSSSTNICDGSPKGDFHIGQSCGAEVRGYDRDDNPLVAGWLRLCVKDGLGVKLEPRLDDCGTVTPNGCGGWQTMGHWHAFPGSCGGTNTVVGSSGQALVSGWVELCLDTTKSPPTDPDTLDGKVMAGYQGWFRAPGDGAGGGWFHWFSGGGATADNADFDLWPDMSELGPEERFDTQMSLPNGSTAQVFSSYNETTVRRHFEWMASAGFDGVFLQRFLSDIAVPALFTFRNKVTQNVCLGATEHSRTFAIMYDISGADPENFVQQLKDDWTFLVDSMGVTQNPAYLRHNGLPVMAIWGLGVNDRPGTVEQAMELINYFTNDAPSQYRVHLVGGVPYQWRTSNGDSKPGFQSVYDSFDTVSPWSVGRYADNTSFNSNLNNFAQPDTNHANSVGLGYAPVVWPGFSWANLHDGPLNQVPRHGGDFFWHQFDRLYDLNPQFLYVAMFDEVDESTAIFKAATSVSQLPTTGQFMHLGQDGTTLPSDWYLRLTGAMKRAITGQFVPSSALPFTP